MFNITRRKKNRHEKIVYNDFSPKKTHSCVINNGQIAKVGFKKELYLLITQKHRNEHTRAYVDSQYLGSLMINECLDFEEKQHAIFSNHTDMSIHKLKLFLHYLGFKISTTVEYFFMLNCLKRLFYFIFQRSVWSFGFFSSPPQRPITSDFEGFLYQILSIILFSYLNFLILNSWERDSISLFYVEC